MYMNTFMLEDLEEPVVSSSGPYIDSDGDPVEATVSLMPFGETTGWGRVTLMMSVDEAEAMGRRLLKVAQLAREGRYTRD